MSVKQNLELVDNFIRTLDARDWESLAGFLAESVECSFPGMEPSALRPNDLVEAWKAEALAFPDSRREKVLSFGQGDLVCITLVETGTHFGPYEIGGRTLPPSGKRFSLRVCGIIRIRGKKITELHVYYDQLGVMSQLGV